MAPVPPGGVETIETMGVASHGPSAPGFFASATCSFPREAAGERKMRERWRPHPGETSGSNRQPLRGAEGGVVSASGAVEQSGTSGREESAQ